MVVASALVLLEIVGNDSLKGKRHVLKSIIARVRNEFNVSVAEVEDHDLWQRAGIGLACVSTDASHANEMLSKAVRYIEGLTPEAQLLDYSIDIDHVF